MIPSNNDRNNLPAAYQRDSSRIFSQERGVVFVVIDRNASNAGDSAVSYRMRGSIFRPPRSRHAVNPEIRRRRHFFLPPKVSGSGKRTAVHLHSSYFLIWREEVFLSLSLPTFFANAHIAPRRYKTRKTRPQKSEHKKKWVNITYAAISSFFKNVSFSGSTTPI